MPSVRLDHVSKTYPNGVRALADFNLHVADGEFLTLVGQSGSGKTTLLRLVAGLEEPTSGEISIGNRAVNGLVPRERDVAMVFQRFSLYPHLSVRANLAFGLRMRGHPREEIDRRVAEAADWLELTPLLDRLPARISGGQQQRAALGKALVRRPAVFLLDEPLSQLDASLRADLRRQLHLLHRRVKATMIYVTHDQMEALTLGDRLAVVAQGCVQQVGSPATVFQHPRNRLVAGFVGWPPMNLVEGRLVSTDGAIQFLVNGAGIPVDLELHPACRLYVGRPVTLGIRPEDIGFEAPDPQKTSLSMEVAIVERVGMDILVSLRRDSWILTARTVNFGSPAVAETVVVSWNMAKAHFFDVETGLNLSASQPDG